MKKSDHKNRMVTEEVLTYPTDRFDFRRLIEEIFETDDLEHLHLKFPETADLDVVDEYTDQSTTVHRHYYESEKLLQLLETYDRFIREVIAPMYPNESKIIYQAKPTFRVHLPGNKSVGSWHRDGDFSHPKEEINFWVPVTRLNPFNSVWAETERDRKDFHPFLIDHRNGEMIRAYLNGCTHGNLVNSSDESRVSFDFRIILGSDWVGDSTDTTITESIKFAIGSYYSVFETGVVDRFRDRLLRADDYDRGYSHLIESFTGSPPMPSRDEFALRLESSGGLHAVIEDRSTQRVVAHGSLFVLRKLHYQRPIGIVEDLVVDPEYRQRGLGHRLLDHLIRLAKTERCYKIELYCYDQITPFYLKYNFTKKGDELCLRL